MAKNFLPQSARSPDTEGTEQDRLSGSVNSVSSLSVFCGGGVVWFGLVRKC